MKQEEISMSKIRCNPAQFLESDWGREHLALLRPASVPPDFTAGLPVKASSLIELER